MVPWSFSTVEPLKIDPMMPTTFKISYLKKKIMEAYCMYVEIFFFKILHLFD